MRAHARNQGGQRRSFPAKYQGTPWLFRVASKLWYTNLFHYDDCQCDGCHHTPKMEQRELFT
jgi:hypothetical protein